MGWSGRPHMLAPRRTGRNGSAPGRGHYTDRVAVISFARGVPTPRRSPSRRSPTARARRRARRPDGPQLRAGRGLPAAARMGGRAPRRRAGAGADHERLAAGPLAARRPPVERGDRVLVEGPTYDRALHIAARHEAEPVPVPMDDEGSTRPSTRSSFRPPSCTRSRPSRTRAAGRCSLERRRALAELAARRQGARRRGRPVRARPLRGRAATEHLRARRRRGRPLLVLLLEDRLARSPGRLPGRRRRS